ncbi:MAG: Outer membrane protein assembly factor BamA [Bacteroidetes bacterium ADurb.Bin037]|nr:MAG: Outer membrane protein assembly factor BamA [Bacteroidetes bacterium ADurb.Bin037]HPW77938.1 hypothetical protein [Bacteroidales bacterium]HQB55396.1 hypothetical protein [Bacteroidales bacterium]
MKKINRLLICLLLTGLTVQTVAADKDSTAVVKKGWTFGALPSIGYNTDLGFQYGALAEVYYYGDGSTFPQYQHLLFVEANYTTKRSGLFRFFYDSKYLIPGVRVTFDLSYIPEAMSDFIGFNGYCSVYNPQWGKTGETGYLSRAFYKMKKEFFRATADFQGTITGNLSWNAGLGVFKYKTDEVNIDFLNRNKDEDKKLPTTDRQPTLYNYYDQWGIIKNNELHGGTHPFVRAGLTFDSRDRPNNPSRGIWADAFLTYFGAFGNQKEYNHLTLNAAFRHYVPLWRDNIIFAYRLGYQGSLWGNSPFYMKNYMATLFTKRANYEMLGGANSLRGIVRNRVTGDGYAYANVELRLKLVSFRIARQAFYIGINPLFDIGYITDDVDLNRSETELRALTAASGVTYEDFFASKDGFHMSAGAGLKIVMNENFILSVDFAKALNKQDGNTGLYIMLGYMF